MAYAYHSRARRRLVLPPTQSGPRLDLAIGSDVYEALVALTPAQTAEVARVLKYALAATLREWQRVQALSPIPPAPMVEAEPGTSGAGWPEDAQDADEAP